MFNCRGTWVVVFPVATLALFAACAPDLKTSDGDGGGSWGEASSSGSSSSSSGGGSSNSSNSSSSSSGSSEPDCMDQQKNGTETDVDCGGLMCLRCTAGQTCFTDADCDSGLCSASDTCAPATCFDKLKNGNETAVDCGGGTCSACPNGQTCQSNADCQSGTCMGKFCQQALVFVAATTLNIKDMYTMPLPTGVQTNDLLLMFITHGGGTLTSVPPQGWMTIEDGVNPSNDPKLDVYYQTYSAGTSLDFELVGSDGSAILAAFRGVSYGAKGTLQNSWSDSIVTAQKSTLIFASLQNGGGEIPAIPTGFTSIGIGNGNMRSMRVAYQLDQPANMYTLTAIAGPSEILPSGTLALALY